MSITNGYCTLTELKARASITDTDDDTMLEAVVEAVSRQIDDLTGDRFFVTTNDETRYEVAEWADLLIPRYAVVSLTTLATDADGDGTYESTWASTDYNLAPYNASLDGKPYTLLEVSMNGNYTFPVGVKKGVKMVGKFGWSTAPKPIHDACIIQSLRIWKRKDAVFGVVGSADMGQLLVLPKLDPDVALLLMPYRKMTVGAAG